MQLGVKLRWCRFPACFHAQTDGWQTPSRLPPSEASTTRLKPPPERTCSAAAGPSGCAAAPHRSQPAPPAEAWAGWEGRFGRNGQPSGRIMNKQLHFTVLLTLSSSPQLSAPPHSCCLPCPPTWVSGLPASTRCRNMSCRYRPCGAGWGFHWNSMQHWWQLPPKRWLQGSGSGHCSVVC